MILDLKNLNKAYQKLTNIGVTPHIKIEEVQRVRLTNILAFSPCFIYLFFIGYGIYVQFYFLVVLCIILVTGVMATLFANYKGRPALAKSIVYLSATSIIFLCHNSTNSDISIICYYFPVIVSFMMVYDIKKELKAFLPIFCFTLLCIAGCFLLPKYFFYSSLMAEHVLKIFIVLNYLFPLVLSLLFMFIIIDMQSNTQEKLIRAREDSEKANRAKSDFLSNMSHELRTPLNGIIGSANLLMHERATLSQRKYYEILKHSSDLMLNLINHILDFSKINERKINLDRNVFNMHHLLSRLCRVYEVQSTEKEVHFVYTIDQRLDNNFVSDDLRLNQILVNLLTNATKFTHKGTISFSAEVTSEENQQMCILFSVKDTGIGIQPEQLDKIFESFRQADNSTTRNFGGTGLGLSICKELVTLFKAQLHVKSNPGEGSEFYFTLRADLNQESAAVPEMAPGAAKDLEGLKILVAEDNSVNMLVLRNFLKKWNARTDEAVNGAEALALFNKNEYDVILLDIEMPVMDGYTALSEIRKKNKKIPVLAFTAALYDNMQTDLLDKGFSGFLHKPFRPNDLYDNIRKYRPPGVGPGK